MSVAHSDLEAMRIQVAELQAENAALKRLLNQDDGYAAELALRRQWRLTGRECDLVLALRRASCRTLSKDGLMDALYNQAPDEPEPKIIDVLVCKIRGKAGHGFIETVWGRGYRLSDAGAEGVDAALASA